jgi:two-component system, chemotaxis family, protein-glutamate methylesterase/glutaminase
VKKCAEPKPSGLVCPQCKGILFLDPASASGQYVCAREHRFAFETLVQLQVVRTEAALFAALRALQEREEILRRLAVVHRLFGKEEIAAGEEAVAHAIALKRGALRDVVNPPEYNPH